MVKLGVKTDVSVARKFRDGPLKLKKKPGALRLFGVTIVKSSR